MALSFFIVSIVGIAFYSSLKVIEFIDSQPSLVIYLKGEITNDEKESVKQIIESSGNVSRVRIENIEFSQEEYYNSYPELSILDDEGIINNENRSKAFPVLAFVYSNSQDELKKIISRLENNPDFLNKYIDQTNIAETGWYSFDEVLADAIKETNEILRQVGLIITILLALISSTLIFITIKLTIQYHSRELEIMELVGADWLFIRLPFIIDGVIYGILGALISTGTIFLFQNFISNASKNLVPNLQAFFTGVSWPELNTELILNVLAITVVSGATVGFFSSLFAIIRYVKNN